MQEQQLTFIGGGNMAASLVGGLIAQGYPASRIVVCDPSAAARHRLQTAYGVATSDDNAAAASVADVVVLAVKPQVMETVARGLTPGLVRQPLVISIAAGVTLSALRKWLNCEAPLVRCMPNTPALVGAGITGLYAGTDVSAAQRQAANEILAAAGATLWVAQESDIDAVTAVSGSGPAYFFLVMEAMMAAAEDLGLTPAVARQLTLQTALGAARMALGDEIDPAELRRQVTSPGGTTEAAIHVLEAGGLAPLLRKAVAAAHKRAEEMAAGLDGASL